jgi:hypothetical protein
VRLDEAVAVERRLAGALDAAEDDRLHGADTSAATLEQDPPDGVGGLAPAADARARVLGLASDHDSAKATKAPIQGRFQAPSAAPAASFTLNLSAPATAVVGQPFVIQASGTDPTDQGALLLYLQCFEGNAWIEHFSEYLGPRTRLLYNGEL